MWLESIKFHMPANLKGSRPNSLAKDTFYTEYDKKNLIKSIILIDLNRVLNLCTDLNGS